MQRTPTSRKSGSDVPLRPIHLARGSLLGGRPACAERGPGQSAICWLAPWSTAGYQRMVARTGKAAGFPFFVHSHMLRHSTGYKLANDGHDTRAIQHYLGHRAIASTVRYTQLAPDRFKHFWRD